MRQMHNTVPSNVPYTVQDTDWQTAIKRLEAELHGMKSRMSDLELRIRGIEGATFIPRTRLG